MLTVWTIYQPTSEYFCCTQPLVQLNQRDTDHSVMLGVHMNFKKRDTKKVTIPNCARRGRRSPGLQVLIQFGKSAARSNTPSQTLRTCPTFQNSENNEILNV